MLSSKLIGIVVDGKLLRLGLAIHGRQIWLCEEPLDELDEDQRDAQAEALFNATTFGAMYLVVGKQDIGIAFHWLSWQPHRESSFCNS